MRIVVLGIDLGKNLCSLAGLDETGAVVGDGAATRARLSGSDASHRICYSAAFITTIAESSFMGWPAPSQRDR